MGASKDLDILNILKKELDFYKGIVQQAHIMLHISEIVDDKYLKVVWANKFYKVTCGHNIEERNKNLEDYYKEKYPDVDANTVAGVIQQMKNDSKPYSGIYKYYIENRDRTTLAYSNLTPYQFNKSNELTHLLISSVFMEEKYHSYERMLELQKEINRLKFKLQLSKLTKTELKVLTQLAEGKSEKEIAQEFSRSLHTIRTQLKTIRRKLGFSKNTELVSFVFEAGIV